MKILNYILLLLSCFAGSQQASASSNKDNINNNTRTEKIKEGTVIITENRVNGAEGGSVIFKSNSVEERKKDIFFKIVATFKCALDNKECIKSLQSTLRLDQGTHFCNPSCSCDRQKSFAHPFQTAGTMPYQDGDGGLLNPILKEYIVTSEKINGENFVGARVELSGKVAADGIAPYEFDKTQYGNGYNGPTKRIDRYTGKEFLATPCWEPSPLEQAILGAVKERAADRQLSDLTDYYFPSEGTYFARIYEDCVKKEWTSNVDDTDSGKRCSPCTDLIKKHFPRSVYWRSQWYTDKKDQRVGQKEAERYRRSVKDTITACEFNTFKVSVQQQESD